MIFLPYKVDVSLTRIPIATILICLGCIFTFLSQQDADNQFAEGLDNYCQQEVNTSLRQLLRNVAHADKGDHCAEIFLAIRESHKPDEKIRELAISATPLKLFAHREDEIKYLIERLSDGYGRFDESVPRSLTQKLQYNPNQYNVWRMITSIFSHANWGHLIGNILFFYMFSTVVEMIVGSTLLLLSMVLMSVTTSLAYSYSVHGVQEALPTIGLSGIVMGMMAMLVVIIPTVKVKCFFWFLLIFRTFQFPALFVATWYIGWDIYSLADSGADSTVNYVAHVSGAVTGIMLGLFYRLCKPDYVRTLLEC